MAWLSFWTVLPISSAWMIWNLVLAFIPAGLSLGLFHLATHRSLLWWLGVLIFVAFLPNAPYVLTDLIHLVEEIQRTESVLVNTLVNIPKYTVLVLLGFGAYVVSLIYLVQYLQRQGRQAWIFPVELLLHSLSAVGIALGRFNRFNSWDLIIQPQRVIVGSLQNFTDRRLLLFIMVGTVIITGLYWLLKQIALALLLRYHSLTEASKIENDQKSAFNVSV